MEYDAQKAARVWQRVQGEKQEQQPVRCSDNLPALIMEESQLSNAYLQLSRQMPGKDGAVYMRLAREAKTQAACMKGILVLMDGKSPGVGSAPAKISQPGAMLRRCYGQELRLLKEYENRRADAEYGPVFERMAARGREHCCTLLELIGGIQRGETDPHGNRQN